MERSPSSCSVIVATMRTNSRPMVVEAKNLPCCTTYILTSETSSNMKNTLLFLCALGSFAWLSPMKFDPNSIELEPKTLFSIREFNVKKLDIDMGETLRPVCAMFKNNGKTYSVMPSDKEDRSLEFCTTTWERTVATIPLQHTIREWNSALTTLLEKQSRVNRIFDFTDNASPFFITTTSTIKLHSCFETTTEPLHLVCTLVKNHTCGYLRYLEKDCACHNQEKILCCTNVIPQKAYHLLQPTETIARFKNGVCHQLLITVSYRHNNGVISIVALPQKGNNLIVLQLIPTSHNTKDRMGRLTQQSSNISTIFFNFK